MYAYLSTESCYSFCIGQFDLWIKIGGFLCVEISIFLTIYGKFYIFFSFMMRSKLKISLFPLTWPTLSKSADWNFLIGNLPSPFFFFFFFHFAQNSLCWKFCILNSFRQKIDIFALPSTSWSSKKKEAYLQYLPTSKIVGQVRWNRTCFTSEKCNVPYGIRSRDLSHCKPQLYQLK